MASNGPAVVWFRRDLRLQDNPAWAAASASHTEIVAVFVMEATLLNAAGTHRRDQLLAHLDALDNDLKGLGGGLVVRSGPAQQAIPGLVQETGAGALYLNRDVSPFSRRRDNETFRAVAVAVHEFDGGLVHEPGRILTKAGTLSQVFTPFYNRWCQAPWSAWPEPGPGRPVRISSELLPARISKAVPAPNIHGNDGAHDRLQQWLERVADYPQSRDLPAIDGTSQLSADLKFGTIAARTVLRVVGESAEGPRAFSRQLAWRDWWAHTLFERQDLATASVKPAYDKLTWREDEAGFTAWATGQTGYPMVDAGMRQLVATGWMHNRARMITASFLVKDLLIDWRRGERFFRHHLIDADLAQNAGNWQWVAGTGPDAAPYFRVFNPTSQGKKFDPDGAYIRRWVPELAELSVKIIHEPSKLPALELAAQGVILGDSYPYPIVDHTLARERTLAAYKEALNKNH